MKNYLLVLFVALVFLFGCTTKSPSSNGTSNDPKIYLVPVNSSTNQSSQVAPNLTLIDIPPSSSAGFGDVLTVNYTLMVDGKVYDTNVLPVATAANLSRLPTAFRPLVVPLELNKSMINGFVLNLIGLQAGDSRSFNVSPAMGYGAYDQNKILKIARYQNVSLYETVPISELRSAKINTTVGSGFQTSLGLVFINATTSTTATLYYALTPGATLNYQGIPQHVVSVGGTDATLEYDLIEHSTYRLPHPETGQVQTFTVKSKDNESISLDYNHPLAGKNLTFNVTVLSAKRYVSTNSSQN
jgi:FKBP-type peptidyl-prolyl cis-trans isomerase 2